MPQQIKSEERIRLEELAIGSNTIFKCEPLERRETIDHLKVTINSIRHDAKWPNAYSFALDPAGVRVTREENNPNDLRYE